MRNQTSLVIAAFVTLAGCAQHYAAAPLGSEHPASTSAAEAPPPQPSVALAGEPAAPTTSEEPSESGGHGAHGKQSVEGKQGKEGKQGIEGMQGMHGGH